MSEYLTQSNPEYERERALDKLVADYFPEDADFYADIEECDRLGGIYGQLLEMGDFTPLVKLLDDKGKFALTISPNRKYSSSLLRKASGKRMLFLEDLKNKVARESGQSKKRKDPSATNH